MTEQQLALIAASSNVTGLLSHDRDSVSLLNDSGIQQQIPTDRFVQVYPDFCVVAVTSEREAKDELARRAESAECLDRVLFLFDVELPVGLRRELSEELEPLLESDGNRDYVLDVLLSKPLPKSADARGAMNACENSPNANRVVSRVVSSQDRVRKVYDAWLTVEQSPLVRDLPRDQILGSLIRCGVFRQLVCEAVDKRSLKSLQNKVSFDDRLRQRFSAAPRIISQWFGLIQRDLPDVPSARSVVSEADGDAGLDAMVHERMPQRPPRHSSSDSAHQAAVSQVDKIVDLFAHRRDPQANTMLTQLVSEQLRHEAGDQYLVRSLCNIASKARSKGRADVSIRCLSTALEYPSTDHFVYFQLANEFRDVGKVDEALECYEKSEQLAGRNAESLRRIHTAKIHIQTMRGEYDEALKEYSAIPNSRFDPDLLCPIADLYRKSGRLTKAREYYESCTHIDPDMHRAFAGLAEIWKQKGKPHRAIQTYNKLFRDFNDLDDGAILVYQLARARLFRMVRQFDRAKALLLKAFETAPYNASVNLQLATLYQIVGNVDQSQYHRDRVRDSAECHNRLILLERISQQLQGAGISAMGEEFSNAVPEDIGLVKCADAFGKLANSRHTDAVAVLENVPFVDRAVEDLSSVLKYHALTAGHFDGPLDRQRINVLAKRGDRSLRDAILASRRGDFSAATQCEAEFLLRAA